MARPLAGKTAGVIKGGRFSKTNAASVQKQRQVPQRQAPQRQAMRSSMGILALEDDEDGDKWAHDRWQDAAAGRTPAAPRRRAGLAEAMPAARQRPRAKGLGQGPVPDNRMRGWSQADLVPLGARAAPVIQKPASVSLAGLRQGTGFRGKGVAQYRTISVRKAIEKRPANGNVLTGSGAMRSRLASERAVLMPRNEEPGVDDSAYSNSGLIGRLPGKGRGPFTGKAAGRGGKRGGKGGKGRGKGKRGKGR